MNFILRTANLSDLDDIMLVEKNGFIPQIQEKREIFELRIKLCPESFLVFENENKKIAGYICGEYLEKMPDSVEELSLGHTPKAQNSSFEYFYISSFSLLPFYRGSGNGKLLWNKSLEYFESNFSSPKIFLLLVNQSWEGAMHIYENSGFSKIQTFEGFFPTASSSVYTDGILMEKK